MIFLTAESHPFQTTSEWVAQALLDIGTGPPYVRSPKSYSRDKNGQEDFHMKSSESIFFKLQQ